MEKVEQTFIAPGSNMDFEDTKVEVKKGLKHLQFRLEMAFLQKGIALLIIGFLLGRALILSHLTPFALPFFASVYMMRRKKAPLVLIGLTAGGITISLGNAALVFLGSIFFLISFKLLSRFQKDEMKSLPYFVLVTSFLSKCTFLYIQQLFHFNVYNALMAGVEASLTFILTLIFMQSIPLLSLKKRRRSLKIEEVVSLIILLASVLTGTIGWKFYGLSAEHILSRYLVLLLSFIGGATVGSTVGVVTGLVFSLANVSSFYQMSLLAFSGLLGGLLKEGKRAGTSAGLLIATLLIGMYGETQTPLSVNLYETLIAIGLLFLTPRDITSKLAKHIPGTNEHTQEQQQYMRKIRDITVHRVEQFSSVFQALSKSFSHNENWRENSSEETHFDYLLSNVTERTCQTCFKKEQCWSRNFDKTYELMKNVMQEMDDGQGEIPQRLRVDFERHCTKSNKVEEAAFQEISFLHANERLKQQVQESRKLVAEQLLGVSEVMGNFAREIQRERENHQKQEEMILDALQDFGLDIEQVEIYSLEEGNVDIDMTIPRINGHGESEKLLAPLLSDILGETIIVQKEEASPFPDGFSYVTFRSAKAYAIETGIAHAAKGGGLISGDSFSTIELGARKYAIAISDGMGNGERAHHESNETLHLLQKILQSGIEEKVAIKSVNSILSLRTPDEIFSTLDLAMIDLQDASAKFLKIGSTPSFIKRGEQIIKIESSNLPMGILQEFDVDVVSAQLKAGDLLIMMSDGIFEGPKHVENYDIWMKRKIKELETDDPQQIADLIMEEVIRTRSGLIEDDMTIVVASIDHNTPKWSAIPAGKKAMIS